MVFPIVTINNWEEGALHLRDLHIQHHVLYRLSDDNPEVANGGMCMPLWK